MADDALIRELGDENKMLREFLEALAQDLEAISSKDEYAAHTEALQARAMRIRKGLCRLLVTAAF